MERESSPGVIGPPHPGEAATPTAASATSNRRLIANGYWLPVRRKAPLLCG
jgi:hypothetical protein